MHEEGAIGMGRSPSTEDQCCLHGREETKCTFEHDVGTWCI